MQEDPGRVKAVGRGEGGSHLPTPISLEAPYPPAEGHDGAGAGEAGQGWLSQRR